MKRFQYNYCKMENGYKDSWMDRLQKLGNEGWQAVGIFKMEVGGIDLSLIVPAILLMREVPESTVMREPEKE